MVRLLSRYAIFSSDVPRRGGAAGDVGPYHTPPPRHLVGRGVTVTPPADGSFCGSLFVGTHKGVNGLWWVIQRGAMIIIR